MDQNNAEATKDPGEEPRDEKNQESMCPEQQQMKCSSCLVTDELSTNGNWSQRSICRSLQRAESLLRNTFNPSLKWLFHHSQDEEEENFVVAHNLVSRSSARLQRLQQSLLAVAFQWQLLGGASTGSPQVCVKGLPADGVVLVLPASPFFQRQYGALWQLLEQRSLLLFVHEYSRRVRLTAACVSRVKQQLRTLACSQHEALSSWPFSGLSFSSLCQEVRVHLSHCWCLLSRVHSDQYLRRAVVQQTGLLREMQQTLGMLSLQLLVLVEQYVFAVLSAVGRAEPDSVPREVLEDVVVGLDLYNQAVEEHRVQYSASQQRMVVLQQTQYSSVFSSFLKVKTYEPSVVSVKVLMAILAGHHADMAVEQLSHHVCLVSSGHEACSEDFCSISRLRYEWTWDQLQHTFLTSLPVPVNNTASFHISPPVYIPDQHFNTISLKNHQRTLSFNKDKISKCQTCHSQSGQTSMDMLDSVQPCVERRRSSENLLQTTSTSSTFHHISALPLPQASQLDHSSAELLLQLLVSSKDLLASLVSQKSTKEEPAEPVPPAAVPVNKCQNMEVCEQDGSEPDPRTRLDDGDSSSFPVVSMDRDRTRPVPMERDEVRWPHSVQWLDIGQSLLLADLIGQYRSWLWILCSKAVWLKLHIPRAGNPAGSINLQDIHSSFHILNRITQTFETGLYSKECKAMLEDLSLHLLVFSAHAHWDSVMCRCLGSTLKDKCLRNEGSNSPTCQRDRSVLTSQTMEYFLLLPPPLLSSLCCHLSTKQTSDSLVLPLPRSALQRQTVSLVLASVQLSTVWVMSKAYQSLSSWSLSKFLLVTQGDLQKLKESLDVLMHQIKALLMALDSDHHSSVQIHNQHLLKQQLEVLDCSVSELQNFSSLVLKTFSVDCKRMSGEIFAHTMPSAVHWRSNHRTGFPNSPSTYACQAAQTVIGQVLEGVALLSDDARVQALSVTMTAFMEAWMEHILKQKIKFSVHGALQLKQDFDSIREMIQSDRYGLPAELHQHLLSLRVFQQVDSAVMCLLQQPPGKPYLQCSTWETFTHCCPINRTRSSIDAAGHGNISNLGCMEGEEPTQSHPSVVSMDLPPVDRSTTTEPYLAPSLALGPAQQEWLDLRIQSGPRRWRLLSLQCLSKAEP
ncbi:uncharacterized protein ccdc142 isoform X2 [Melanotaenia boesemani]|uniref:uncharacterized protein ccdc142 isoform X2 n=1 Tax=Melanotaenia boesemani TaxID=1250792 RepID=UPI001C05655F|nr:uncharacterized protein ccdc142 isoform X2 [Melanotaenia boesemani]